MSAHGPGEGDAKNHADVGSAATPPQPGNTFARGALFTIAAVGLLVGLTYFAWRDLEASRAAAAVPKLSAADFGAKEGEFARGESVELSGVVSAMDILQDDKAIVWLASSVTAPPAATCIFYVQPNLRVGDDAIIRGRVAWESKTLEGCSVVKRVPR